MNKLITIILLSISIISCRSLKEIIKFSSSYVEIENPVIKIKDRSNYFQSSGILKIKVLLPDTNLTPGSKGIFLIYRDTTIFFNPNTYEETFKASEKLIPIEILSIEK